MPEHCPERLCPVCQGSFPTVSIVTLGAGTELTPFLSAQEKVYFITQHGAQPAELHHTGAKGPRMLPSQEQSYCKQPPAQNSTSQVGPEVPGWRYGTL